MKYVVIVPDGMADLPVEAFGGKTPLESAITTNMDYLARHGMIGLVRTIPEGMPPGSDIGNMALMGYDPRSCHTGRAPLEAASLGLTLQEDEIAVRCNFVTVTDDQMADYSAGHISTREADLLIQALNEELAEEGVRFYTGKSYRHILLLKGILPEKYLAIKTVAPHDIMGQALKSFLPSGAEAAVFLRLMERSRAILDGHSVNQVRVDLGENPANMIWLWGQGTRPRLPLFADKYRRKGALISAVDLVRGLGRLAGFTVIDVPGVTGYYDTNYSGKAAYALEALKTHDFVFIHIEAPDEAGHNGDFKAKREAIERVDKEIVGAVLNAFEGRQDLRILVLPDHPTPVKLRTHTADPVGFVMCGPGIDPNHGEAMTEQEARGKGLLFESGEELLSFFLENPEETAL